MDLGIAGKTALVCGASKGLGFGCAEALVSEVAAEMAEKKYGAAIIVQHNKVVGIFTMVDACRVLAELFDTRLKS